LGSFVFSKLRSIYIFHSFKSQSDVPLVTWREQLKIFIKRLSNVHRSSNKREIFICSIPRSSSTWLNEFIVTQRRTKCIDEPLNPRSYVAYFFTEWRGWEFFTQTESKAAVLSAYFCKIQSDQNGLLNPRPFSLKCRFLTDRLVHYLKNIY